MNKAQLSAALSLGLALACSSAHAAPILVGAPGSISQLVSIASPSLLSLNLPAVGSLGGLSLTNAVTQLPGLQQIQIPVIGNLKGIPVLSSLTVVEGIGTLEAIGPLQQTLPGLNALQIALPGAQ